MKRFLRIDWSKSEARDAIIVCAVFAVTFLIGSIFDVLEKLIKTLQRYEAYELDELLLALIVAAPLLLWYAARRAKDARRELTVTEHLFSQLKSTIAAESSATFPLETLDQPGMAIDKPGKILRWNDAAADLFGYSAEEAIGQNISDLIYTEKSVAQADEAIKKVRGRREILHFQGQRRHKTGRELQLAISVLPVANSEGQINGAWVFYDDISDEFENNRLVQLYRQVWENTDVAVTITDEKGVVIDCSPAVQDLFGLSRAQLIGGHAGQIVDIMDSDDHSESIIKGLASDGSWVGDIKFKHPNGSIKHVEHRVFTLKAETGERVGGASISVDISQRTTLERSLRESEQTVNSILNYANVGITFANPEGVYLKVNPAFCHFLGREESEIIGQKYQDFALPNQKDDKDAHKSLVEAIVDKSVSIIERSYRRRDGAVIWGRLSPSPVYDSAGQITSFVTVIEDITERRISEQRLLESESRLKQIIDATDAGLWDLNAQSGVIVFNDKMKALSGYGAAFPETIEAWEALIHPDDIAIYRPALREWSGDTQVFDETHRFQPANGEQLWVRSRGRFERGSDGQVTRGLGLIWDVTNEVNAAEHRQELEDQLAAAQKMEAVGRLTGGMAHDFNNILTIVSGSLQLLPMLQDDPESSKSAVDRAQKACARAASLTARLLSFSRQQSLVPKVQDVRSIVSKVESVLSRTLNKDTELSIDVPDDPITCRVDGAQLQQAILNLTANATDAMAQGGRLTIGCSVVEFEEESQNSPQDLPPGQYACIEIQDNGCGMTKDVLEKAVEPFYTTKEVGEGSGLGLSMAYGFMQQSGGGLFIKSSATEGTAVKCYLPLSGDASQSTKALSSDRASSEAAPWVIMVVEDEVDVRDTTRLLLEAKGFKVVEASDGNAAIDLLEGGVKVDLVFSDVTMPGSANGIELANHIYQKTPHLPVVLTTGFAEDGVESDSLLSDSVTILPKPYDSVAVISLFRQLLGK